MREMGSAHLPLNYQRLLARKIRRMDTAHLSISVEDKIGRGGGCPPSDYFRACESIQSIRRASL